MHSAVCCVSSSEDTPVWGHAKKNDVESSSWKVLGKRLELRKKRFDHQVTENRCPGPCIVGINECMFQNEMMVLSRSPDPKKHHSAMEQGALFMVAHDFCHKDRNKKMKGKWDWEHTLKSNVRCALCHKCKTLLSKDHTNFLGCS